MEWWIWIVLAGILCIAEMLVPLDFYLLFLGGSALAVGVVSWILEHLGMGTPLWLQLALFASVAPILLFSGRRLVRRSAEKATGFDQGAEIEGQEIEVLATIDPGELGRGFAKGTSWNIRNVDNETLEAGDRCRVVRRIGLTLEVSKAR